MRIGINNDNKASNWLNFLFGAKNMICRFLPFSQLTFPPQRQNVADGQRQSAMSLPI